jgi:hypothetical protein
MWYVALLLFSVIIATVFYFFINTLLFIIFDLSRNTYGYAFLYWQNNSISDSILNITNIIKAIVHGRMYVNLPYLPATFIMAIITLVLLPVYTLLKIRNRNTIAAMLTLCLIILAPFVMIVLFANSLPLRAYTELGIFVASIWTIFFMIIRPKLLKYIFTIAIIILISFQARLTTQLMFSDYYLRSTQDYMMAIKVSLKVDELGMGAIPDEPVVFVGSRSFGDSPTTTATSEIAGRPDSSFFGFGGGDYMRIHYYLRHLGIHYIFPDEAQAARAVELSADMPAWPMPGSVASIDGIIIVRLS